MFEMADEELITVDQSGCGLTEIPTDADPHILILDDNAVSSLPPLDGYTRLQQLSLSHNLLTSINGLGLLHQLTVLNLSHNSIAQIQGLRSLANLLWLNLSGNNIKVIEGLDTNLSLNHLDLSHNKVTTLSDLSHLIELKTLLLHNNSITTLRTATQHLPISIHALSLADNNITDLNEVGYLSPLVNLQDLSLMNNPCVCLATPAIDVDYRPFIVNWCINLQILDGSHITEKEGLKAEWLYSQGRGRQYRPGQHQPLIHYLSSVCPLTTSIECERAENVRLSKVLQFQRVHQQQLHSPLPPSDVTGSPTQRAQSAAGDRDPARRSLPVGEMSPPPVNVHDMELVDVRSSDESAESNQLEGESRYLPLHSDLSMSPLRPFNFNQYVDDRPQTAPAQVGLDVTDSSTGEGRPSTAGEGPGKKPGAISHGHVRRIAANFSNVDQTPATDSQTKPETDNEPDTAQQTHELKLLKAIVANRKTQKTKPAPLDNIHSEDVVTPDVQSPKSPYRSQYSPDKYTSPGRRSVRSVDSEQCAVNTETVAANTEDTYTAESGGSQLEAANDTLENVHTTHLNQTGRDEACRAATRLQAAWRGYLARHKDPAVVRIRQEIRARRAEDHISHLRQELDRQRQLYEQEKHVRGLQVDALKHLWKEVHALQQWKSQVLTSPATQTDVTSTNVQTSPNATLSESASSPRAISPTVSATTPTVSSSHQATTMVSDKEVELENTCKSLQKQVCELQDVLSSMSSFVFQGGVINATHDNTAGSDSNIRVSTDFDTDSLPDTTDNTVSGVGLGVPHPGAPTSPASLRLHQYSTHSVVLYWQPSLVLDTAGLPTNQPIIGYRLYVNGLPKGMVAGMQTRALLEGLQLNTLYKVFVRGVSALGESYDSNTVEFTLRDPESKTARERTDGGSGGGGGRRKDDRDSDRRDSDSDDGHGHEVSPAHGLPTSSTPKSSNQPSHTPTDNLSPLTPIEMRLKANTPPATLKAKAYLDFHSEFVQERSRSDDSGYWTSPSTTLLQQQNKSYKGVHDLSKQESVLPHKSKNVNALLEIMEQRRKSGSSKGPSDKAAIVLEDTGGKSHLLRVSTADSKNSARKSSDTPLKAFRTDSAKVIAELDSKSEKSAKREVSKIPVFTKKSSRVQSKSTRGSMSDSELAGKGYPDAKGEEVKGSKGAELEEQRARRHSDSVTAKASPRTTPRRPASTNADDLNLDLAALEADSQPLFQPKPPEGSSSPRKPLSRRNSLRGRHHSGRSETSTPVCESSDTEAAPSCDNTADLSHEPEFKKSDTRTGRSSDVSHDPDFKRSDTRTGRSSVRISKSSKEAKTHRRSSSVGAILSKLTSGCCSANTVIITDRPPVAQQSKSGVVVEKPPIGRTSREPSAERRREGSVERRRESSSERRHHRRRTKSEQGAGSDLEDMPTPHFYKERRHLPSEGSGGKSSDSERESSGEAACAVIRSLAQEGKDVTPKKKPFSSSKRSGSEFTGIPLLPDRPESPAPRDRRSPNTPTQAPSSPRVRRSSSFSKNLPEETLKAVKKSAESPEKPTNPTRPTIHHRRTASSGELADPSLPSQPTNDRPALMRRGGSMRDEKLRLAMERTIGNRPPSAAAEAPPDLPASYSPRVRSKTATDGKTRKVKLPNKAADLFAKLQTRLSNNKMS